jgi:hypothetical protein
MIATCIGCGCTDDHACWDELLKSPCRWERLDRRAGLGVCSVCHELADLWDIGDREMRVPIEPLQIVLRRAGSAQ